VRVRERRWIDGGWDGMKMDPISLTRVKGLGARVEQMRCDGANEAVTPRVKDWMMKKSQRKPKPPPPQSASQSEGSNARATARQLRQRATGQVEEEKQRGRESERERVSV
jgi:hypothetical protein